MLLAGDIGSVPQKELPYLRPDVLLVPHHGSGTSDLDWLRATVGDEAVISVGINTYGHPSPEVVDAVDGTAVRTTREHGDLVIDLG